MNRVYRKKREGKETANRSRQQNTAEPKEDHLVSEKEAPRAAVSLGSAWRVV